MVIYEDVADIQNQLSESERGVKDFFTRFLPISSATEQRTLLHISTESADKPEYTIEHVAYSIMLFGSCNLNFSNLMHKYENTINQFITENAELKK